MIVAAFQAAGIIALSAARIGIDIILDIAGLTKGAVNRQVQYWHLGRRWCGDRDQYRAEGRPEAAHYSAVSRGGFLPDRRGRSGPSRRRSICPSLTPTLTTPPLASLPNSSSSASGFLMCSWITRARGRAPILSS